MVDEDGVHQVRLFRAPVWSPEGGGVAREAGGTVAESLVERPSTRKLTSDHGTHDTLYRVGGES